MAESKEKVYKSKAITTEIKADSKITLKIKDNYYSVSLEESRTIPDIKGVDMELERKLLFEDINAIIDDQANEILKTFGK